jgi:hypothetical protein
MCNLGSALQTSSAVRRERCSLRLFPRTPVPSASRQKFILPWSKSLPEFLTTSWPPSLSVGPTSLRFLVPPTTSLGLAPFEVARRFHLGSARRLSQPLSGFLARPSFVALFRATAVPGILPSEVSPHRRSLAPLGVAWLPCGYPPACSDARCSTVRRRFRRRPRVRAVAWFPRQLWDPFQLAEAGLLVALGLTPQNRLVPQASPTSKLHSLLRVRSRPGRVSSRRSAGPLLGFCPSRASSFPASESLPARARGSNTRRSSEDSQPAT